MRDVRSKSKETIDGSINGLRVSSYCDVKINGDVNESDDEDLPDDYGSRIYDVRVGTKSELVVNGDINGTLRMNKDCEVEVRGNVNGNVVINDSKLDVGGVITGQVRESGVGETIVNEEVSF
jgi:hypothetical protein